ncbi:hypothetical protein J1614_000783 [Plenodomus biglobosus]|nr:hypothetical protein J1614_000783 [Plenodomus biglobosus]
MANNDDRSPRRDLGRPEDNPFIAFRRFADSHVSSLLNTVFTLPATIANYNHAHQAREQCLFGKADERQCDKLHELEAETAELRRQGRELFREGDVQAVLRHSDMLLELERKAEEVRRSIVQEATRNGVSIGDDKVALVERVASQKGRDWGAEWDWGVPKPFDGERRAMQDSDENERSREFQEWEMLLRLQSEVQKLVAAFDGAAWDDPRQSSTEKTDAQERPWAPFWEGAQPREAGSAGAGVSWRGKDEGESGRHCPNSNEPHDEPSYEYSHDHEDQHDEPPSPRANHASSRSQAGEETEMDAYEQLVAGLDKPSSVVPATALPSALTQPSGATSTSPILSTLTTTERTVTADGLVTTKVVLKKRFADGREESSETIHTQKSDETNSRSQQAWQLQSSNAGEASSKNVSRSGWFWSS